MTEVPLYDKFQPINNYNLLSNILILFVATTFAFLVGSGFYGYGSDFYVAYYKSNLVWGSIFDRYGYFVATFTVLNTHLGVHIVTFILSVTVGLLLREFSIFKREYSIIFFIFIYIISIHTWPIIMSTSNAMRQGLAMSFMFLALITSYHKKYIWMLIFSFVAIFMHKSGIVLIAIIFFSVFSNYILAKFSYKSKLFLHLMFGLALLTISFIYLSINILEYQFIAGMPSKIIHSDFRWAFIIISILYIILAFFFEKILENPINITLFYYSFISQSILMNGLNWEYERLGMMMLIPYILSYGMILNRPSYKIYLIIIFLFLLFLTIYQGMYASFK